MGQKRIVVTQHRLKPWPFIAAVLVVSHQQLIGEGLAHQIDSSIATHLAQIFMDGLEPKRPGAWARCLGNRGQRHLKQIHGPVAQIVAARSPHTGRQGQQGAAQAIIGAILIEPGALEAHEIMKAALFRDICIVDERSITTGECLHIRRDVARFLEHHKQLQSTNIVIGTIAFLEIRKCVFSVLINTC